MSGGMALPAGPDLLPRGHPGGVLATGQVGAPHQVACSHGVGSSFDGTVRPQEAAFGNWPVTSRAEGTHQRRQGRFACRAQARARPAGEVPSAGVQSTGVQSGHINRDARDCALAVEFDRSPRRLPGDCRTHRQHRDRRGHGAGGPCRERRRGRRREWNNTDLAVGDTTVGYSPLGG